jgi:very-short-patch-repair endonuclease
MSRRLTRIEVIDRANIVHNYKYIYNKMDYVDANTKMCITCPIHGDFWQRPANHLNGDGCPKCGFEERARKRVKPFDEFVEEARRVHGNKYIYNEDCYVDAKSKTKITCPAHGDFWQDVHNHLAGHGCPQCVGREVFDTESFVKKSEIIHNGKYIYGGKTHYVNNHTKVCITCPIHGDFWQTPNKHLAGQGCPKCAGNIKYTAKSFATEADLVHKGKYIYNDSNYVTAKTKIEITCPVHGPFWQTPTDHLQGKGCPKCARITSKAEDEISDFIAQECHLMLTRRDRTLLGENLECDIVVPCHKLAIEFDGIIWHSEKFGKDKGYHLHKTELAESKGYHLIHIFEDEWLEHKELVLNKIRHILKCDMDKPVVGARKCTIKTLSKTLAEPFLTSYHLQGFVASTAYYGAFYGDILVGVMTFKKEKPDMWNLTRFATNIDYRLPGLANKMLKQFIKDNNPMEIKTFLDRRWSHCNKNVYDEMSFKLAETLGPDYRYVVKGQRLHKFGFRKQILAKKYNLPLSMTEKEMTEQLGFYRIWDCGLYKYVWKKNNNFFVN